MASIGSITGSKLIGCPIIVPVTAGSNVPDAATFHRVRLAAEIDGTIGGTPISGETFEFSTPVTKGDVVKFDISSAFRAVADKFSFEPDTLSYPSFAVTLTAYDDYLLNGEEHHNRTGGGSPEGPFYIGRLTDRERLTGSSPRYGLDYWSRKPRTSPEIAFTGCMVLAPGSFGSRPAVSQYKSDTDGKTVKGENYYFYTVPKPADGYEMRFINSLGVHESCHVRCLPQTEVNITTDKYVISRQETINKFSRAVMHKQNDYEQWKMSSGPLDRAWQQWWLHEPLMAKWAWLKVDGQWLPVHIVPEETTKGVDRSKADALTVEFTLRFDINGSPFA